MSPDAMSVRLHLRRIRVVAVVVDLVERLVVEIADVRRVVRCPHCGFKTARIHDRRRLRVCDLPTQGRETTLIWIRRRFACGDCGERSWETHPEIILGRRTHVTRRLARQLVRDVGVMSIREVGRRHGLPWHFIMTLTRSWSDRVAQDRRRRRCRVLLIDETSLRRGHQYVTVLINGDTGDEGFSNRPSGRTEDSPSTLCPAAPSLTRDRPRARPRELSPDTTPSQRPATRRPPKLQSSSDTPPDPTRTRHSINSLNRVCPEDGPRRPSLSRAPSPSENRHCRDPSRDHPTWPPPRQERTPH